MAITHGTTYGGGQLARIYDRLRKRSQRRYNSWLHIDDPNYDAWFARQHAAYVAGVNDALNLDTHGKALSFLLLQLEIPLPPRLAGAG